MGRTTANRDAFMAVAAAREIEDGDVAFIGTGLPMIGAYLAKYTHAPAATLVFESGIVDPTPVDLAGGVGDYRLAHGATKLAGMWYALGLLQQGKVDIGFLGVAEVDPYGNINSTAIGPYGRPKVRLPGSGGANDIASMAKRFTIVCRHQKQRLVEQLHYLTTPGFLSGPGAREKAGLPGGGPVRIITDLAVMGFDPTTRRAVLQSVYPGVTPDDIRSNTGFDLSVPADPAVEAPPTNEQLHLIHEVIDPTGLYVKRPT